VGQSDAEKVDMRALLAAGALVTEAVWSGGGGGFGKGLRRGSKKENESGRFSCSQKGGGSGVSVKRGKGLGEGERARALRGVSDALVSPSVADVSTSGA